MTTDFWSIPAEYPCGPMPINADLKFSFDFASFVALAGDALTLASVTVSGGDGLTMSPVTVSGTQATMRVTKTDKTQGVGQRIGFTLRPTLSDGQTDEWSYLLEITKAERRGA